MNPKIFTLLKYYTPKLGEKQAYLSIFTLFVNYAYFLCQHYYVNQCCLKALSFTIFDDNVTYCVDSAARTQNVVLNENLQNATGRVNFTYPPRSFVQVNDTLYFSS